MNHLIIAPVLMPALLAPLIVLALRDDLRLQRLVSVAGTLALTGIALGLLGAARGAPQVYELGNWPAPFGIVLVLDRLSALMVALTAVLALGALIYAAGSGWDARGRHFHALFQFQLMGLCGAFLTGDAFNLFVFFEVMLIASYGLLIHGSGGGTGGDGVQLAAGIRYVITNLAGSVLFLFALGLLYALTGTLNMADMAQRVAALPPGDQALMRAGAVMLMLVFALKAALVPLQFWLPAAYAAAPGPVAALFAVMTKVGAYAILRFATLVFPADAPAVGPMIADWLLPVALLTLATGTLGALGARDGARLAGFAGIASMGTILAAFGLFTPAGTAAGLYYMIHSTFAGAGLFLIADLTRGRHGGAAQRPLAQSGFTAALFMAAAVAMAGLPPLSGFVGKLLVLEAARNAPGGTVAWPFVWAVILIASLISVIAFARAGSDQFWKSALIASPRAPARNLPQAAVCAMLAALVALTLFAAPVTGYLTAAAAQLHDPARYIAAVMAHRTAGAAP